MRWKREDLNRVLFDAPVGVVIAERASYTRRGKEDMRLGPTQKLLDRLQALSECKNARVVLAGWDKERKRVDHIGGCELEVAFSP